MTNAPAQRTELIGGQQFTRPERTAYLGALIDRAQAAIERAACNAVPAARVLRDADLLLSSHAVAIPDLAMYRGGTHAIPDLVVEYRAESTDRLFFGPKRMAYARARVPEVWFVDPLKAVVTVLRLGPGLDYPWPAETFGRGATIASSSIAGLHVPADALIA